MRPLLTTLLLTLLAALPASAKAPTKLDLIPIDAQMAALVARYRLDGASLWVSHNGVTLLNAHYGRYSDQTRVPIASASKWVSALVLARLVERGALRWDSRVGEWWPTASVDKRDITLAQLFSHTSGLPGDESGCIANALTTLQTCAAQILMGPMAAAPGTTFAYGGQSMQVAGGVRSSLADYRRLMAMWQADGRIVEGANAGQRYLASATIRMMQRDHSQGLVRTDAGIQPRRLRLSRLGRWHGWHCGGLHGAR